MSTTTSIEKISQPSPAVPLPKSPLSDFYVLWFVKNIPHHEFLIFEAPGKTFPEVIDKAKNYCSIMQYRFLIVRPLVANLQSDINRKRNVEDVGS